MRTFVVKHSDLAACPLLRLDVAHYREDGSCKCRPPKPPEEKPRHEPTR